jgi:hypothetical protein
MLMLNAGVNPWANKVWLFAKFEYINEVKNERVTEGPWTPINQMAAVIKAIAARKPYESSPLKTGWIILNNASVNVTCIVPRNIHPNPQ